MPILKGSEIDWKEDTAGKRVAFLQGKVDECKLSLYNGEIDGYQLRVKVGDGADMRHVYWRARINNESSYQTYDAPKLAEIFNFTGGIDALLDNDCSEYFMGQTVGLRITPNPTDGEKYYVNLFTPRQRDSKGPSLSEIEQAKIRLREKLGKPTGATAAPVAAGQYGNGTGYLQSPPDESQDDLPF